MTFMEHNRLLRMMEIHVTNHGYEPQSKLWKHIPRARCGVLYPPLRGIVQLTNSAVPSMRRVYLLAELEFHNKSRIKLRTKLWKGVRANQC